MVINLSEEVVMRFAVLVMVFANVFFLGALQARPLQVDQCWTDFEKAPEDLIKLCKVRFSEKTKKGLDVAFFFVASYTGEDVLYPVVRNKIQGGVCSWGESFRLLAMDTYTPDAENIRLGTLSYCDSSGYTRDKVRGELPGGAEIVTGKAD